MIRKTYESAHKMLVLIAHAQSHSLNMHAQLASGVKDLNFGPSLHEVRYFMYASSEGSNETWLLADAVISTKSSYTDSISCKCTCT